MSKNKNRDRMEYSVQEDSDTSGEITINLKDLAIPIAIIINSIIIAIAILLAGRETKGSVQGATVTPKVTESAQEENPAKQTILGNSPYLGDKDTAKIAIVEFSDYECPFCQRHHNQTYPQIYENYIKTGQAIYVFKNFVAVKSHDPVATTEGYAALCVKELAGNSNDAYFKMNDLLYKNTQTNGAGLPEGKDIYTLGASLGVDANALKTCVESEKYAQFMSDDAKAASDAGIQGTPAFIVGKLSNDGNIDGKLIYGAYPFDTFKTIADEMLQ